MTLDDHINKIVIFIYYSGYARKADGKNAPSRAEFVNKEDI